MARMIGRFGAGPAADLTVPALTATGTSPGDWAGRLDWLVVFSPVPTGFQHHVAAQQRAVYGVDGALLGGLRMLY
jgi:hypothetical protein